MLRMPLLKIIASFALWAAVQAAWAGETSITWYGHAAFKIVTPKGHSLVIDPWLSNPKNPYAQDGKDPIAAVGKVDYILITHGHFDHVKDATALAKSTNAKLVTNYELANNMAKVMDYPLTDKSTLGNIGGEIEIADGEVMATLTPAVHSSGLAGHDDLIVNGGSPAGIVLVIKDGPTIYHTGDTAYFSDMKLINEFYAPDLGLINIGGHFGMEPPMAARAAATAGVKVAVPMHYATFPILTQDAGGFVKDVEAKGIKAVVMKPGETIHFEGKQLKQ